MIAIIRDEAEIDEVSRCGAWARYFIHKAPSTKNEARDEGAQGTQRIAAAATRL